MKPAIICEKRPAIVSFIKQTLQLTGYEIIEVITQISECSTYTKPFVLFTDIEFAYTVKDTLCTLFKQEYETPEISFYQVDNDKVISFWVEGVLKNQFNSTSEEIFIRSRGKLEKVRKKDILYVEADKKYCIITTLQKKYIIRTALKHLFAQLNHIDFVRVHRSYLINKNHIMSIDTQNQSIIIEQAEIPIGRFYQSNLFEQIMILQ